MLIPKTKLKDPKYLTSFRDCPCLISLLTKCSCDTSTVVAHHISGKNRDDWTIPLGLLHHTEGKEAVHNGKKTWHNKHLSKEDCIELAEFAYGFWETNKVNLFSLNNIQEVIDTYFENNTK